MHAITAGLRFTAEQSHARRRNPQPVGVASADIGRPSRRYVRAELLGLTGSNPLRGLRPID
jgi:hypothetical protein